MAREQASACSLDDTFEYGARGQPRRDGRWVFVHMVEEYARHNGHADLVRELVAGATGR